MKVLIRLRLEDGCVVEIDPSVITSFRIDLADNGKGDYMLTASSMSQEFILLVDNARECNELLKQIHSILDVHIIDI